DTAGIPASDDRAGLRGTGERRCCPDRRRRAVRARRPARGGRARLAVQPQGDDGRRLPDRRGARARAAVRPVPFRTDEEVTAALPGTVPHLRDGGLIAFPAATLYGLGAPTTDDV